MDSRRCACCGRFYEPAIGARGATCEACDEDARRWLRRQEITLAPEFDAAIFRELAACGERIVDELLARGQTPSSTDVATQVIAADKHERDRGMYAEALAQHLEKYRKA